MESSSVRPRQARYQAALRPDSHGILAHSGARIQTPGPQPRAAVLHGQARSEDSHKGRRANRDVVVRAPTPGVLQKSAQETENRRVEYLAVAKECARV